jgi:sugar lactone lactonase YvrE
MIESVTEEITGLGFPEALRWRDGSLWWSDMFRGRVMKYTPGVSPQGVAETVWGKENGCPDMPGGLGWLPDGTLLVVDCLGRQVLAVSGSGDVSVYVSLTDYAEHPLNDMCVDDQGVAWVGGYGFNPDTDQPVGSPLYRVSPDRSVTVTDPVFIFPNGMEQSGDHLVVAETFANRVSTVSLAGDVLSSVAWPDGSGPDGLSHGPAGQLVVASAFLASLDVLAPGGKQELEWLFSYETPAGTPGGKRGVFDCAYHPDKPLIACSVAALDEDYGAIHDTGAIVFLTLHDDTPR